MPDEEMHLAANEAAREASAFLFGRGLYDVREEYWTEAAKRADAPPIEAEFARAYVATPRYVFSDSLEAVPIGVELVRRADSEATVKRLKAELDGNMDLGGAGLAASLIDLIDEFRLFVNPVAIGGGKPFFPVGARLDLELVEERRFPSGGLLLRYRWA